MMMMSADRKYVGGHNEENKNQIHLRWFLLFHATVKPQSLTLSLVCVFKFEKKYKIRRIF